MAENGAGQKDPVKDSCEFYSRNLQHVQYKGIAFTHYINDKKLVAKSLNEWMVEYTSGNPSPERQQELKDKVLANTFFLILHEIKKWNLSSIIFEEAVQNSCIAVIEAMDEFDPTRRVKFTTYLIQYHIIKTAVREAIDANSVVRVPSGIRKRSAKKARELVKMGREPDSRYGSHVIPWRSGFRTERHNRPDNVPPEEIIEGPMYTCDAEFIEDMAYDTREVGAEQVGIEDHLFSREVRKMCEEALCTSAAGLTENEKITLKHKRGLLNAPVLRNKEIVGLLRAHGVEVSEPRVCQYHQNALRKLKAWLERRNDAEFASVLWS